ncbi:unnamed protein product [Dicrocoelium dendriticum]|nr:unnamed protein product [Dicrocoelium dendriticum]
MLAFILLNVVLFFGAYLAGCIPMSFNFPTSRLRIMTVFGTGLLLGAVLAIIIPEGIEALYSGQCPLQLDANHAHSSSDILEQAKQYVESKATVPGAERPSLNLAPDGDKSGYFPKLPSVLGDSEQALHSPLGFFTRHQLVGLSLLIGYLFMLLVDQLGGALEGCFPSRTTKCCPVPGLLCCKQSNRSSPVKTGSGVGLTVDKQMVTATLGLVFHSFADGLALGAAFAADHIRLKLVLFLAIIIHKLPAAFGLSCYLVHSGLPRGKIRVHLLVFAAASPLASIITYFYLTWPFPNSIKSHSMDKTGLALLVSGGTFLYVAASHILPDIVHTASGPTESSSTQRASDEYTVYAVGSQDPLLASTDSATPAFDKTRRMSFLDLFTLIVGSLVPLTLSMGHVH